MADPKPTFHHLNVGSLVVIHRFVLVLTLPVDQNSQSQRILWLLEELEIPYNLILHKRAESGPRKGRAPEELSQTHPLGKAPQLVTKDGTVIVESLVIAKYLIDTYDTDGKFKGDGQHNDALRDDQLSNFAAASLGPLMNLELIMTVLTHALPFFIRPLFSLAQKGLQKGYTTPEFRLYFQYLNDQLGDQDYFLGANPGRADFIMKWPMDLCIENGFVDAKAYPNVDKWLTRVNERPAWKRSLEKGNGYTFQTKL